MSAHTAINTALTAMADELASTNPGEPFTNRGRIAVALRATVSEADGTFDAVLVQTAPIQLPMTRGEYATALRQIATPPAPDDGTPTNDPAAALHWAAVAIGLAEARTEQGNPLTDDERTEYDRYQDAARAHGFTEQQVRDYLAEYRQAVAR